MVRAAAGDAGPVRRELEPRLIYVYIGGRVFLDNPVFGTGWEGELPPHDYAQYLADARERFSDQPPHYFPPATGTLIPQQTWDQVLFELGLVGAALFVVLRRASRCGDAVVAGRKPRPGEPWGEQAYVPLGWLAVIAGAIAGAALFGGSPLAALFWLALGVARGPSEASRRSAGVSLSIVHVIARLNVGGAALHVLQLAHEQSRRGHDVVVVAGTLAAGEESMEYVAEELGVERAAAAGAAARALAPRRPGRDPRPAPDHPAPAPGRPPHPHRQGRRHRPARRDVRRRARGRGRSSTPTTATSSAATSAGAGSGSSARSSGRSRSCTGTLIAVSDEVRDDLVAFGVAPAQRFVVVPYGFDLPPWGEEDERGAAGDARRDRRRRRRRSSSAGRAA